MAPSPDDFDRAPSPAGSPRARDLGLRRARRLTRWAGVTAVTGAAALGGLYSHLLPGGTADPPAQSPSAPSTAGSHEGDDGGHEDDGPAAPGPPSHPPTATQQQPHTTTGAS